MPKIKVEIKYGDNIGLLTPRGIELCLEEFFKKQMYKFKIKEIKSVGLDERKMRDIIVDKVYGTIYDDLKIDEKKYINETIQALKQAEGELIVEKKMKERKKKKRVKHIIKENSRFHVLYYNTEGFHCSEVNCEINKREIPIKVEN